VIKIKKDRGFTLVELLAVIVILAIILVIAVPKIMDVIKDTTKASLESSAKMVAAQVENQYTVAQTLSKEFASTGSCMQDWAGLNESDYTSCSYEITNDGTAKVTLVGKGKFKGLSVCSGTRSSATATESICLTTAVRFEDDDWATIVGWVQQGNYPYEVGDTKTIDLGDLGEHTLRIANTTTCSEVSVESKTACGFVLEFADIITEAKMNDEDTHVGGWPASKLYEYVNNTIYKSLPEELRNGIIDTTVKSSDGDSGYFTSTDKLYFLTKQEIYGDYSGLSRQLDWYVDNEVTSDNYSNAVKLYVETPKSWWLRDADPDSDFYIIYASGKSTNGGGDWDGSWASYEKGVSPAFRLSN